MSKKFEIKGDDISDGYHTFNELYEHRVKLFIALIWATDYPCFCKEDHYDGWDALYLETPAGQISYHVPKRLRFYYTERSKIIEENEYNWDGHTSLDVLNRLSSLCSKPRL